MAKGEDGKFKGAIKGAIKGAFMHIAVVAGAFLLKILPWLLIAVTILNVLFNRQKEINQGKNTAEEIYSILGETDLNNLIEVKGNDNDGYYWGFVDDADERLDDVIEKLEKKHGTVTIESKNLLKKMILAQVVTQYPDLGGKSFTSSKSVYSGTSEQKAEQMMRDLSLEDKVSQMLFVLTSNNSELSQNAGGYVLEDGFDFSNAKSSIEKSKNKIPAIFAVDEEGGTVQRALSGYPSASDYIDTDEYHKLQEEGNSQEAETLLNDGLSKLQNDSSSKAKTLLELGIQMNLSPVADVSDKSSYMGKRSFSPDYKVASSCVETAVKYMKQEGLITCLKHFPGYANAKDTHNGSYVDNRSIEEVQEDMAVFQKGINAGAATVMTSHIIVESIDSENPASLSSKVVNKIRNLGFDGVIITDALNMHALNGEEDIYVRAVNAGNDVLEVTNFEEAKQQIIDAVNKDKIKVSRINDAVTRILTLKFEYNLINEETLNIKTSFKGGIIDVPKIYMKDWNVPFPNYPSQNVSTTGCGFVAAAMIVSYFTGTDVTPKDIVDWGYKHYNGKGANGDLFVEIAEHWNFGTVTQTNDYDKVVDALKSGYPVVSLQHTGQFTKGGHYIVLTGIDEDGRAHVNDPASEERTEKTWDLYGDIHSTNDLYFIYDSGGLNKYDVTIDSEEVENFQGAIHLRRVTPDKEIGAVEDVSTGVTTKKGTYVTAQSEGLGTKEDISESLKEKMEGVSMNGISGTSYDDLSYLTIPYYDFNGKVQKGHMVVNKELADEVLLIFQELYNIRYPIQSMDLVDEFKNKMNNVDFGSDADKDAGTKLDITSAWYNNTSSFNDRTTSSGAESNHATGCAIDINPLINPYVASGNYSPLNAKKYTDRSMSDWTDIEKKAVINKDSEIYKIFKKYGWSWGGDWNSVKDYQHFEKEDLSNVAHILSVSVQEEEEDTTTEEDSGDKLVAGDGKQYVVAIDAGHGPAEGAAQGYYKTGTSDSSGLNTGMVERDYTKKVADAVADKLSIYSNLKIVRIGNSDEHPIVKNTDRVNMAKEAGADLYITIHYNGSEDKSVSGTQVYYPSESGYPEDTASKQLAEVLSRTVSSSIGIRNHGVFTEDVVGGLVIIKHSSLVGFPCVCIEGGFMSNQNDVNLLKGDEGVERYAKGVADGILEYCGLENKGYGQVNSSNSSGSSENNAGIRSKVYDLKYVSKELFEKHVNEGNLQALNEFTIDEDDGNKIVVATWSSTNGEIKISTKKFQASSTYTQKYTMPIEYLLAYYIDTRNKEFIIDLADLAMNSEFVLAIQDNVTTTETKVYQSVNTKKYKNNRKNLISNTTTKPSLTYSNTSETVSTSIELTYGDTWFVKFYKDINYSASDLNVLSKTGRVNTVTDIDGNVSSSDTSYEQRSSPRSSTVTDGDNRIIYVETDITNTYTKSISYKYNTGEMHVLGNEQKFITIYKKNEDFRESLKPEWLFKVLEQQVKTSNMIDLTKYLIYLAGGQSKRVNYGVKEFNFSEYAPESFTTITGIYGNTVEEKVWFAFRAAGYSEEATAGVMGNIYQESTFIPYNANWQKGLEWSKQYMESVDNGNISREEFIHDGQGCGLVGWTFWTLKQALYDYAKSKNSSIADPDIQIQLLLGAVNPEGGADGYMSCTLHSTHGCTRDGWVNATSPEEAARQFCWIFENPGDSEANISTRQSKAREYYEQFKGMTAPTTIGGGDSRIGQISLSGENAQKMVQMLTIALQIADDDSYWYVYGAAHNGPSGWSSSSIPKNFDCSSFVGYLYYTNFGIYVGGDTGEIHNRSQSYKVSLASLQPGDILWRSGHVGIYIGNDQYVHASSSKNGIIVSSGPTSSFTEAYRYIN